MENQKFLKWVLEIINQEGYRTVSYLDAECSRHNLSLK